MMTHGGDVWQGGEPAGWLDYSANLRPGGAPEWVRDALMKGMKDVSYYPDPSMKRERAAMAEYLKLPEDCVCPTAGGISAIDMASHVNAEGALLFTPCFGEYAALCRNRVLAVSNAALLDGHKILDPALQARLSLGRGQIVWLCNPLNPVGCAFSPEVIERLLTIVEDADGWLVVDEAFIEYCPERSVAAMIPSRGRLLVAGSLTKILGIPGVRLGYLCAQPRVLEALKRYQLTWELNCFASAVARALPEHAEDVRDDAEANKARREGLRAALEGLGTFVYPSEASFLLTDFARPVAPIIRRLKARGILTRDCASFEGLEDGNHLRLAVKDDESNARLIEKLREALQCAENR